MRRRQRQVRRRAPLRLDVLEFVVGRLAPKEKSDGIWPRAEDLDDAVGECLPSLSMMGAGFVRSDGQSRIEEEDPLLRPIEKASMSGRWDSQIVFQLLEDILQ